MEKEKFLEIKDILIEKAEKKSLSYDNTNKETI